MEETEQVVYRGKYAQTFLGAGIGAVIGAVVGGPLGAVVGGAIGGGLGAIADTAEEARIQKGEKKRGIR